MKIKLDRTVCDGFGKCAEHAPSVFSLDEWGYAYTPDEGVVPDGQESAAREAVSATSLSCDSIKAPSAAPPIATSPSG